MEFRNFDDQVFYGTEKVNMGQPHRLVITPSATPRNCFNFVVVVVGKNGMSVKH